MKTIILVVTTDLSYDQRLQRIANALSKQYRVTLLGRKMRNSILLDKNHPYLLQRIRCRFSIGFLFYAEFNIRVALHLWFHRYDVVTANDLDTALGVYVGTRFKTSRLVFDAHEWFTEVPELDQRKWVKKCWKWIDRHIVPRFDRHYTVNQSLADIFYKKNHLNYNVIMNVPSQNTFIPQPSTKEKTYLLYQGALNAGRGLEVLIEAMKHISIPLKIAGDGDLSTSLRKQVKELQLEHKIEFLGRVSPIELKKLTGQAWLGVNLLSNNSKNYYYSLANKFFDYAFAGIPQLCMDFPEYARINEKYEIAYLIHSLDKESIIQAINIISQDETLYTKLKNQTKIFTKAYCWEKEEEKLFAIYQFTA